MGVNQPDLDGGAGDIGGDGGGVPGTGTGSSQGQALPVGENGGLFGNTYVLMVPVQDTRSGECYIGIYDTGDLDDLVDDSFYSWREEDIVKNRVPTVNRLVLVYRDLGPAQIVLMVSAINDDGERVTSSVTKSIGNANPTGNKVTVFCDLSTTGFRPQVSMTRISGPVDIISLTMRGTVEEGQE